MILKYSALRNGSTVSRVLQHINSEYSCAVISAYLERDPNTGLLRNLKDNKIAQELLKKEIDSLKYGYIQLRSKFKDPETGSLSEEESALIPKIPFEKAIELGKKYGQYSILAKDENGTFGEIQTRVHPGEWVQIFSKGNTEISEYDFAQAFSQLKYGNPNARDKRIKLSCLVEMTPRSILPIASMTSRYAEYYYFIREEV